MAFKDILGHDRQISILKGFFRKEKVPSCFVFSGDSGIGKFAVAINFAKLLNCNNITDNDSCDNCVSCKKIDSNIHPDLSLIDDSSKEIKVETIRRLEDFVYVRPFESSRKIVIIDEAHRMNQSAQNAFLKTLEEPPDYCYFLLVTSSPDVLFETVRSRCVNIRFNPLSASSYDVVVKSKKPTIEKSVYSMCIGRPGGYLSGEIRDRLESFFLYLADMKNGEIKERWRDIDDMKAWLEILLIYIRDILVFEVTKSQIHQILSADKKGCDVRRILDLYNEILNLYMKGDMNLNKKIVWNYVREMVKDKI